MTPRPDPRGHPDREASGFVEQIGRKAERMQRGRALGFWRGISLIGGVGWMIAGPAIIGVLFGRWLDGWLHGSGFWTASLLICGLALGCAAAWRNVARELFR